MWALPGPRSFVKEILSSAEQQHVAAVLPAYLASDELVSDDLAAELALRGHDVRRVLPWSDNGSLAEAIGFELVDGNNPPVTVAELLGHPALVRRVVVLNQADLEPSHAKELPEFLRRLEAESRTAAAADRCSVVVLTDRAGLPSFAGGDRADVGLANVWYWNRIARWDVAAHLALLGEHDGHGVLAEMKVETIVEIARWDFALASRLAACWDGDPSTLPELLEGLPDVKSDGPRNRMRSATVPPDTLLVDWDHGRVESWHGITAWAPRLGLRDEESVSRLVWHAQARVLLPWIETHRVLLEATLEQRLGAQRLRDAADHYAADPRQPDDVMEIALLKVITKARVGSADVDLTKAAQELWLARNALAHLRPMRSGAIEELVRLCARVWP